MAAERKGGGAHRAVDDRPDKDAVGGDRHTKEEQRGEEHAPENLCLAAGSCRLDLRNVLVVHLFAHILANLLGEPREFVLRQNSVSVHIDKVEEPAFRLRIATCGA